VGFEASVRVPLSVGFMVNYTNTYKIIVAVMPGNSKRWQPPFIFLSEYQNGVRSRSKLIKK
jgi:hypothetical protein